MDRQFLEIRGKFENWRGKIRILNFSSRTCCMSDSIQNGYDSCFWHSNSVKLLLWTIIPDNLKISSKFWHLKSKRISFFFPVACFFFQSHFMSYSNIPKAQQDQAHKKKSHTCVIIFATSATSCDLGDVRYRCSPPLCATTFACTCSPTRHPLVPSAHAFALSHLFSLAVWLAGVYFSTRLHVNDVECCSLVLHSYCNSDIHAWTVI